MKATKWLVGLTLVGIAGYATRSYWMPYFKKAVKESKTEPITTTTTTTTTETTNPVTNPKKEISKEKALELLGYYIKKKYDMSVSKYTAEGMKLETAILLSFEKAITDGGWRIVPAMKGQEASGQLTVAKQIDQVQDRIS